MTSTITARIDSAKKQEAEEIFQDLGMTFSGAINVFVNEVVRYQGIPFSLRRRTIPDARMEAILDETDDYCHVHDTRLSHNEVFGKAREVLNAGRSLHA